MRDTLWDGAGIKIIGAGDDEGVLTRLFGREPPKIPLYQFAIRWGLRGEEPPVILTEAHDHLHGGRNDMPPDDYDTLIEQQLATYYTRRDRRPHTAGSSPPALPSSAPRDGLGELL